MRLHAESDQSEPKKAQEVKDSHSGRGSEEEEESREERKQGIPSEQINSMIVAVLNDTNPAKEIDDKLNGRPQRKSKTECEIFLGSMAHKNNKGHIQGKESPFDQTEKIA